MPPPQQAPEEGGQQQSKITGIVRSVAMFFAVQMGQFAPSSKPHPAGNALTSCLLSFEIWHVLRMSFSVLDHVSEI